VTRALALRWSGKLASAHARGALGLGAPLADAVDDAARIVKHARQADIDVVREALRWYAMHYASTTDVIAQLRDVRALSIPEVDLVRSIDGARTMQTIVNKAAIGSRRRRGCCGAWRASARSASHRSRSISRRRSAAR
jgi:hypothetical protein